MKHIGPHLFCLGLLMLLGCGEKPAPAVEAAPAAAELTGATSGFDTFIQRKEHQLFDGEKPFRFFGLHATELHRIEDDVRSKASQIGKSDHFKWPTAREQENWVKSLVWSGHTATRIYALSIDDISLAPDVRKNMPAHVLWDQESQRLVLNEDGMQVLDRLVYLADLHGLRLIIPFVDHWSWWGGKRELALMAGEPDMDDKVTGPIYDINSQTYALYQDLIRQVIGRTNTLTGRKYSEEKAIMAWETGNELRGTNAEFLAQTAALIKSLAPHQLIVDGDQQADSINLPDEAVAVGSEFLGLVDPNVDIMSNHFYGDYMSADVVTRQADLAKQYGKVFFVGEYGLQPMETIRQVTDAIVAHEAIGGALIWGYRGHREAGGFYWHKEGDSGHLSYHLPGFAVNAANQEQAVVELIRQVQAGFATNEQQRRFATEWPDPEAPLLHPIGPQGQINWMGSPMVLRYNLYKANARTEWHLYQADLTDGSNGWDPAIMNLYQDSNCQTGDQYRLTAVNPAGESIGSEIRIASCN
ncbi:cellulase family glycosylhydrolase [Simiduia agarivorans]|uniref:mannan endo-1,4-beta-mannosidase n=1 Tax=Simiduia agarivorans (strain DSM 21679 / JCM 13881 / BCRC 17597 / SA1) TaxID=1117647 RepID=K4KQT6_SIMAS|nr:cellulase family glycosylhydrolase [Simiduia agarivorans]AFV00489.2 hypothetical protein M5M_16790 [Simiduia agarivorans SA1 = DSM 21679]